MQMMRNAIQNLPPFVGRGGWGSAFKKQWNQRIDVVLISRLWWKNSWMLIERRLSEGLDPGTAGARQGSTLCEVPRSQAFCSPADRSRPASAGSRVFQLNRIYL